MQAVAHNPKIAKKTGISKSVGEEFVSATKAPKKLPERLKDGGPSLAIGRGEKLPVSQGAGLTAKGRAKYNRETGSNLKAPQPEGGPRKDSFCARMRPIAEKSEKGSRARASMRRWKCSGF
jgi:hypothetical protein